MGRRRGFGDDDGRFYGCVEAGADKASKKAVEGGSDGRWAGD